jgi:transporter family-2 protein
MVALVVAGQMLASLLLDHFGWLGYDLHPMNLWRLAGVILLVAGVVMIRMF